MLADLANSVDCAVGPSGVNPLKALADAVDGSAFRAAGGFDEADAGGAFSQVRSRDGAGSSSLGQGSVGDAAALAQHETFAQHFAASARKQPAHPMLERAWAERALQSPQPPPPVAAALESAWAAARAPNTQPAALALGPAASADLNPAVIECVRAFARADDAAPAAQLRQLAARMAVSLSPELRARAAARACTHARLALGLRAHSAMGAARLHALAEELGAFHQGAVQLPAASPAERASAEQWAAEFAAARAGGGALGAASVAQACGVQPYMPSPAASLLLPLQASAGAGQHHGPHGLAASFWAARAGGAPPAAPATASVMSAAAGVASSNGAAAELPSPAVAPPSGALQAAGVTGPAALGEQARAAGLAAETTAPALPADSAATAGAAAAAQVTAPMIAALEAEAAASGDARFERSALLSFLRDVHDGKVDLGADLGASAADGAERSAEAAGAAAHSAALAEPAPADALDGPDALSAMGAVRAAHQRARALASAQDERAASRGAAAGATDVAAAAERAWADAVSGDVVDSSLFEGLWDQLSLGAGGSAGGATTAVDAELGALPAEVERALSAAVETLARQRDEAGAAESAPPPPYSFAQSNPHAGAADALGLARRLRAAGRLAEAVLAAEAAVRQAPDDSEAWQLLGQLHADCDDDSSAIVALRHAVAADPANCAARLLLGVSCTNELDQPMALHHLRQWLRSHPHPPLAELAARADAAEAAAGARVDTASEDPFGAHERLARLFTQAAELATDDGARADVHAVLGVLYNLSLEYAPATAAFERALQLRPADASLWNKLGATCANAMQPERALSHYVRALELQPDNVRVLTNLGISYGNLGKPMEGAACYLRALELNPRGSHIWGYLTMLFHTAGRDDLAERAAARDVEVFRGLVDF